MVSAVISHFMFNHLFIILLNYTPYLIKSPINKNIILYYMTSKIQHPQVPKGYTFSKELDMPTILSLKFIKGSNEDDCNGMITLGRVISKLGLTLVTNNSIFIELSGPYSSFVKMLNVRLYEFVAIGARYYTFLADIILPQYLSFIVDILGLDNFPRLAPRNVTTVGAAPYKPPQIAKLYNFPNKTGLNQSISIISLSGGYMLSDIQKFFTSLNLKVPTINEISVDGAINDTLGKPSHNIEITSTIEIIGSVINDAKLNIFFAPNTVMGFYDALYSAITSTKYKTNVISSSWGAAEYYWTSNNMNAFDSLFQYAIKNNINIIVSSGDLGSSDIPGSLYPHVDFPASSPNVVSCGGTRTLSDGTTIKEESVWYTNKHGSGGGYSSFFKKPIYQYKSPLVKQYRGVPDLAANADPASGYSLYCNKKNVTVGGTSAACALMSALLVQLNQIKRRPIDFFNNYLYERKICKDVVYGENGHFKATLNWDPCSGNGRVDGSLIIPIINPY